MESRHNCQIGHYWRTSWSQWRHPICSLVEHDAGVEKVKRQRLQLKPDQASWAQNSDMELVKPMMVLYMDEGDVVVIAGVVECWSSCGKLGHWRHPSGRCRCRSQFSDVEVGSLVVSRRCDEVVENELWRGTRPSLLARVTSQESSSYSKLFRSKKNRYRLFW